MDVPAEKRGRAVEEALLPGRRALFSPCPLENPPVHLPSVQVLLTELDREPRVNRGRARRCNRGRMPHHVTVRNGWEDAAGGGTGSQKTCLDVIPCCPRGQGAPVVCLGKIRDPRTNHALVRGFFFALRNGAPDSKRRMGMETNEQSFSRITIFFIKDWDGFQRAMRSSNGNPGGVQ